MTVVADTIEIPISKVKTVLLILGCLGFVCGSVWLWTIADIQTRRSPLFVKAIAVAGVLFFGLGLIIGPIKLLDKRPGLIIDNNGILNNLGFSKGYFIPWSSIKGFNVMQVKSTKVLLVYINNADEFISREGKFSQMVMRVSNNTYGTPISISSGTLQIKFDQLEKMLTERLATFSKANS